MQDFVFQIELPKVVQQSEDKIYTPSLQDYTKVNPKIT